MRKPPLASRLSEAENGSSTKLDTHAAFLKTRDGLSFSHTPHKWTRSRFSLKRATALVFQWVGRQQQREQHRCNPAHFVTEWFTHT